jgi:signal transduction histidine kinase
MFRPLLAAPTDSEDAERGVLSRLFYVIAVTIAVALGIAMLTNLVFTPGGVPLVLPAVLVGVGATIAIAWRGRLRFACALLPVLVLAGSVSFLVTRDGVHDVAVIAIAGTLVIGSVLLTRRAMVMLAIAALTLTLGAGVAELSGSLQNRFSAFTDVRHVVAIGLILLVIAVAARLMAESLFAALRRARENSAALRELSAHHDSLREEERARVAREIHDELGQALTALRLDLSALEMKFGERAPEIGERVRELKGTIDGSIARVRSVVMALRPASLDLGFVPAIEGLVADFRSRTGIHCTVKVPGTDVSLAEERGIVLFRVLQESLTNVSRHAAAHDVEVTVEVDDAKVRVAVEDDGQGFDVSAAEKRGTLGLLGIRERVIMLGGDLKIRSSPGEGTQVSVSIPSK